MLKIIKIKLSPARNVVVKIAGSCFHHDKPQEVPVTDRSSSHTVSDTSTTFGFTSRSKSA